MEEKCKAVAFTGHRPETIPYIDDTDSDRYFHLEKAIWQEVHRYINAGYNTFYCGAARGADMLCGEIILSEKETNHPELKLVCAIPFKEQARGWGFMEKLQYRELLRRTDRIVQVCDSYQRGCYHVRNRYMVDNSDVLIAIYNGEPKGGTAYTVNYAWKQGKEITIINPDTFEITVIHGRK